MRRPPFFNEGGKIDGIHAYECTDSTALYTCSWAMPKTRRVTYSLSAQAFDAANNEPPPPR